MMETENQGEEELEEDTLKTVLRTLVRTVVKCFYEPKDLLIIDLIIKEESVTVERVQDVLKFDVKLVRLSLAALKRDRILYFKSERVSLEDGKTARREYYFVKYGRLVNVVKYKLVNVRKKLETLERDTICKLSFHCKACNKGWSDADMGEIIDVKYFTFRCLVCKEPLTQHPLEAPEDTRRMIAKFNEQTTPIYDILKKIELLS